MRKTVQIGEKNIEMSANAATAFRYKQVFKKDLLAIFANEKRVEEEGATTIMELAYIMSSNGAGEDMNKLSYDRFLSWLEQFEPLDFVESADEIVNVYTGQMEVDSKPFQEKE